MAKEVISEKPVGRQHRLPKPLMLFLGTVAPISLTLTLAAPNNLPVFYSLLNDPNEGKAKMVENLNFHFSPVHLDKASITPEQLLRETSSYFNTQPDAQMWMREVPITFVDNLPDKYQGRYLPRQDRIEIEVISSRVLLHELAHKNFSRKNLLDRVFFSLNLVRLLTDGNPTNYKARMFTEGLASVAAKYYDDFTDEAYAYLAEWSGGDLSNLPEYLRYYYKDFLNEGANRWIIMQQQLRAGQSEIS
jgi:hypothetical protein